MKRLQQFLPAILIFLAALAAWEGLVRVLDIPTFLLPAPPSAAH